MVRPDQFVEIDGGGCQHVGRDEVRQEGGPGWRRRLDSENSRQTRAGTGIIPHPEHPVSEAAVSKHMERDLEGLRKAVLQMAAAVERAVYQATAALQDHNLTLARKVVAEDAEIDALENSVQEECLKVMALHQPVAADLRRVAAVLLISTDLERMGDLAVNIAERAECLTRAAGPAPPARFAAMTARVTGMVRRALDAFVADDAAAARGVIGTDREVDADNDAIIAELVRDMTARPGMVEAGLNLFSAVRHLERIADHATNIAEDVIYLVDGELVRHALPSTPR